MLRFVFEFVELLFLCSWGICIINSQAWLLCAPPCLLWCFIAIGSLPYIASYLCPTTVCIHVFFSVLVLHDRVWLRATTAYSSFVHCKHCNMFLYCFYSKDTNYTIVCFLIPAFNYAIFIVKQCLTDWENYFIQRYLLLISMSTMKLPNKAKYQKKQYISLSTRNSLIWKIYAFFRNVV